MIKLRISETQWDEVTKYHLANKVERLSFLFGRMVKEGDDQIIIIPPQKPYLLSDDCFKIQSGVNVKLHLDVQKSIYAKFLASDFDVIINIHDHWFSKEKTLFSATDDTCDISQDKFIRDSLEPLMSNQCSVTNLSLVLDQETVAARITNTANKNVFEAVDQIQILSRKIKLITPNNVKDTAAPLNNIFNRQKVVVSKDTQGKLSKLKIGLVGAGGLGSILAEGLIRLGIEHITLVDDDLIEQTNLNRLQGVKLNDVGKPKAQVIAEHIQRLVPSVCVDVVINKVNSEAALEKLRTCDVLIGAVDNDLPRYILNKISAAYLIPYTDLATRIFNSEKQIIDFKQRQFVSIPTVTSCLECTQVELLNNKEINHALSDSHMENLYRDRGYLTDENDEPTASIYGLNLAASGMLLLELSNLFSAYKPLATVITQEYQQSKISRLDTDNFPEESHPHCSACGPYFVGKAHLVDIPECHTKKQTTGELLSKVKGLFSAKELETQPIEKG